MNDEKICLEVKPLEWVFDPNKNPRMLAYSKVGLYVRGQYSPPHNGCKAWWSPPNSKSTRCYSVADEKAAREGAQEHYRAQILSEIINPTPAPTVSEGE